MKFCKRLVSKKLLYLLLLLLWMGLIFFFSGQKGGDSSASSSLVLNFLNSYLPFDLSTFFVRKLAHFSEFFILFGLFYNYFRCSYSYSFKLLLFCLLFCFFYAVFDEVHQLFILERSASFIDVLIDTSGSLVLFLIVLVKKGVLEHIL